MGHPLDPGLEGHAGHGDSQAGRTQQTGSVAEAGGMVGRLEHAGSIGRNGRETTAPGHIDDRATSERAQSEHGASVPSTHRVPEHATGPVNGFWADADWLLCRDGKWRPVEPGTFPLAHGTASVVGRVCADKKRLTALPPRKDQGSRAGRLKGYGNAIVAPQAVAFIECVIEEVCQ